MAMWRTPSCRGTPRALEALPASGRQRGRGQEVLAAKLLPGLRAGLRAAPSAPLTTLRDARLSSASQGKPTSSEIELLLQRLSSTRAHSRCLHPGAHCRAHGRLVCTEGLLQAWLRG